MFDKITSKQVRLIAELAKAAGDARDALLHGVVDEPHPAKGEIDQIGSGAFDVLPADNPAVTALRDAIGVLACRAMGDLRRDADWPK